jgi:hypothetical protein
LNWRSILIARSRRDGSQITIGGIATGYVRRLILGSRILCHLVGGLIAGSKGNRKDGNGS